MARLTPVKKAFKSRLHLAVVTVGLTGLILPVFILVAGYAWSQFFPPPRPVFYDRYKKEGRHALAPPRPFEDASGAVFFADRERNAVLVISAESPLLGDGTADRLSYRARHDSILLRNEDDPSLSIDLKVRDNTCYFIDKSMKVRSARLPHNLASLLSRECWSSGTPDSTPIILHWLGANGVALPPRTEKGGR
jgi:hypothetical protein